MKSFSAFLKKCFCLPPLLTVLVAIPGFALILAVAVFDIEIPAVRYFAYIYSAYSLVIVCTGLSKLCRAVLKSNALKQIKSTRIVSKYVKDSWFRADVAMRQGFLVNAVYAVFKIITAFVYRSVWFGAVGGYYLASCVIGFYLIRCADRSKSICSDTDRELFELDSYRNSAVMLLGLDVIMSNMIHRMIVTNQSYEYPGTIIYMSAAFAFYNLIIAVVNTVKYRKRNNKIYMASKVLKLASALMSLFALQTALLSRFGSAGDDSFRLIMNMTFGGSVSVFVGAMAIYIIINSCVGKKKLKSSYRTNE